jgi:branched-chain amino acid aminotransferase
MHIEVHRTNTPRALPQPPLGFGRHFSDHVFRMDYALASGWHSPRVEPNAPISLDLAASVLHYGQAIFEGLKAFRGADGVIRFFRPEAHALRFQHSARLICMPEVPVEAFVEGLHAVVRTDEAWVPSAAGSALYVRPTMVATEAFLGVRPAHEYVFFHLLSPVGAYYAEGFNPLKIWVETERTRACPGGIGTAKTGGNYAASLGAAEAAKKQGFAQVLWLDGARHEYLEEVGTMNLFVKIGGEVLTPSLDVGSILAGVTRDSILTLLRDWGVPVSERRIAWRELVEAHDKGTLEEVFGTGTAAVISPVGELASAGGTLRAGDGGVGPLAKRLYDAIVGIQYGTAPDPHAWTTVLR